MKTRKPKTKSNIFTIYLVNVKDDLWRVVIRSGKIKTSGQISIKPRIPVSFEEAFKIFEHLKKSKLASGYVIQK